MVKFANVLGEALTIAIRIARAYVGEVSLLSVVIMVGMIGI